MANRSTRIHGMIKYLKTEIVVFTLLLTSVFPAEDSPWLNLNISSTELCSMTYGNFRVDVYEHFDNRNATTIQGLKKYFYTPMALLDQQSVFSTFNNLTQHPEMRFRIEMRNDKLESELTHYLKHVVKKQVNANQVQVIPLDKVILASTTPSTIYYLSRDWLPYRKQKSLWFSLICFEQNGCDKLVTDMRANPREFENFQLLFGLSSQSYKTQGVAIETNTTISGKMASTLLKRIDRDEVLLTAQDEKRLLIEMTNAIISETFDNQDAVASGSELQIYNMLRDMLVSSRMTIDNPSDKLWKSVFWKDSNYRPDKTAKKLNKIYSKQSKRNQEKLTKAYSNEELLKIEFDGFIVDKELMDKETPTAKDFLEKLYEESKNYVAWDYEKFIPKPLSLAKIDLSQLREETVNTNYVHSNDSLDEERGVRARYTTAALSISLAHQEDSVSTNECANIQITDYENEETKLKSKKKMKNAQVPKARNEKNTASKEEKLVSLLMRPYASLKEIECLVHDGVDVNKVNRDGLTPLLLVTSGWKENIVEKIRLLIEHGVDLNYKDKYGRTAIHHFIQNTGREYTKGNLIGLIQLLIDNGVDMKSKDNNGWNALHYLFRFHDEKDVIDIVLLLMEHGVDINSKNIDGRSALHFLFTAHETDKLPPPLKQEMDKLFAKSPKVVDKEQFFRLIETLIEHGADMKSKDIKGSTILQLLLSERLEHFKYDDLTVLAELLIEKRVDLYSKDKYGRNALHYLCLYYHKENSINNLIQLLIDKGIDVNAKDIEGSSALHYLSRHNQRDDLYDTLQLLVQNGINIYSKNNEGRNVLHYLSEYYHKDNLIDLIRYLIDCGIDLNSKDSNEKTALHYLCRYYQQDNLIDIIQLLIDSDVDLSSTDNEGSNALHVLCRHHEKQNIFDIIKRLTKNGMDVTSKNRNGWSALTVLCRYYEKDDLIRLFRRLIQHGVITYSGPNALVSKYCDIVVDEKEKKLFSLLSEKYPRRKEIEILIRDGVDVNYVNQDGLTPLLQLTRESNDKKGLIKLIELLLESGSDLNYKDNEGSNVLLSLCKHYQQDDLIEIVELLLEYGIHVNSKANRGWNALQILSKFYKNDHLIESIKLLIKYGADVNSKNIDGLNFLHFLCEYYRENNLIDLIELLMENGIDVNAKDNRGWNALTILSRFYEKDNLIELVRILIKNGIDVNAKDNEMGWSALNHLCKFNHNGNMIEVVRLLISHGSDINSKDVNGLNVLAVLCSSNEIQSQKIEVIHLLMENGIDDKSNKGWDALTLPSCINSMKRELY